MRVSVSGADFLVVLVPTKPTVFESVLSEAERTAHLSALTRDERSMWERTKTALNSAGIHFVDALAPLKQRLEQGEQPYFISQDGHPNAVGQRAIAELVADWIESRSRDCIEGGASGEDWPGS